MSVWSNFFKLALVYFTSPYRYHQEIYSSPRNHKCATVASIHYGRKRKSSTVAFPFAIPLGGLHGARTGLVTMVAVVTMGL